MTGAREIVRALNGQWRGSSYGAQPGARRTTTRRRASRSATRRARSCVMPCRMRAGRGDRCAAAARAMGAGGAATITITIKASTEVELMTQSAKRARSSCFSMPRKLAGRSSRPISPAAASCCPRMTWGYLVSSSLPLQAQ